METYLLITDRKSNTNIWTMLTHYQIDIPGRVGVLPNILRLRYVCTILEYGCAWKYIQKSDERNVEIWQQSRYICKFLYLTVVPFVCGKFILKTFLKATFDLIVSSRSLLHDKSTINHIVEFTSYKL